MSGRVSKCLRSNSVSILVVFVASTGMCDSRADSGKNETRKKSSAGKVYQKGVVAADHVLASQAGAEILRKGGNVVDAAVATAFVLSIVRPESSGLGGGGFMVIWDAKKQRAVTIDYRERASQKATRNMYRDPRNPKKALPEKSRYGHSAIAVPGTVSGLCYALEKYGTLDLKTVMQPAIRLARNGFPIDSKGRSTQKTMLGSFQKNPRWEKRFAALKRLYLNNGKPWNLRDRFYSPQLKVLQLIVEKGANGFYRGEVAKSIVAECQRGGGLITHEDLKNMQPVVRQSLIGQFDAYRVITMPPPSSGGTALLEMLNTLSAYERSHPKKRLEQLGHNRPAYVHLLTEIMKHAFADRAEFLGDMDFAKVPVSRLISRKYAVRIAEKIDLKRTKPLKEYGRFLPVNDGGTSHFSIIDSKGNAVACTETINTTFGSLVVEPKYGIVLNNEMDDFAAAPGQPNAFGLIQSEANSVQAGKKPLSSMTPTILVKNGKAVFVAGASGGPRIISSTLQVLLNMSRFGMSPEKAVREPRFHHQWVPNSLLLEGDLHLRIQKAMKAYGHKVERRKSLSAIQAVGRSSVGIQAGSDPRKGGTPAGY